VPVYILRRLALSLLSLFVVSFAVFWVFASRFDPLWPLRVEGNTTPEGRAQLAAITTLNHLDDPIVERYWRWLRGILTGHGWGYTVLKSARPQLGQKPSLRGTPIGAQLWPALGRTSVLIGASVGPSRTAAASDRVDGPAEPRSRARRPRARRRLTPRPAVSRHRDPAGRRRRTRSPSASSARSGRSAWTGC
jgi:binding-protein-dependent transport system inner membrane component